VFQDPHRWRDIGEIVPVARAAKVRRPAAPAVEHAGNTSVQSPDERSRVAPNRETVIAEGSLDLQRFAMDVFPVDALPQGALESLADALRQT